MHTDLLFSSQLMISLLACIQDEPSGTYKELRIAEYSEQFDYTNYQ